MFPFAVGKKYCLLYIQETFQFELMKQIPTLNQLIKLLNSFSFYAIQINARLAHSSKQFNVIAAIKMN